MTARIHVSKIHALSGDYALELYEAGSMAGDYLIIPMRDAVELKRRYGQKSKMRGLGDLIHKIAAPIAKVLKLSCIDKATGKLKPQSPCAKRMERMNNAVPFNK